MSEQQKQNNIYELNQHFHQNKHRYKPVGSREDVYLGYASKTSGGMRKSDIVKKDNKGQVKYLSKKIGERMRSQIQINGGLRRKIHQTLKNKPIIFNPHDNRVVEYNCNQKYKNPPKKINELINDLPNNGINIDYLFEE